MLFGRQNNLTRRAFRPDQQTVRQLRRQGMGKASLLDVQMGGRPESLGDRLRRTLRRWLRRR